MHFLRDCGVASWPLLLAALCWFASPVVRHPVVRHPVVRHPVVRHPVDPHVLLVHSGSPRGTSGAPDRLHSRKITIFRYTLKCIDLLERKHIEVGKNNFINLSLKWRRVVD